MRLLPRLEDKQKSCTSCRTYSVRVPWQTFGKANYNFGGHGCGFLAADFMPTKMQAKANLL